MMAMPTARAIRFTSCPLLSLSQCLNISSQTQMPCPKKNDISIPSLRQYSLLNLRY